MSLVTLKELLNTSIKTMSFVYSERVKQNTSAEGNQLKIVSVTKCSSSDSTSKIQESLN